MKNIVKDQMRFFDMNAHRHAHIHSSIPEDSLFVKYANKEQFSSLNWLVNGKVILDYGCGTGETLERFLRGRDPKRYKVYGVDIAEEAIHEIAKKYPAYDFFKIKNNLIPLIKDGTVDGAYMMHILHHAREHDEIFKTVYAKLKNGGKYVINDLSSNNPFLSFFRGLFTMSPNFVKKKFSDDLVVDGMIPEKYKVNIQAVVHGLKDAGFTIEKIGYGHLFFFMFGWIDKFIPLSKAVPIKNIYKQLIRFERWLLSFNFFQNRAEVFYIKAIKT
jgi:ubiquinone/menaquinone biosynthesis C-methylase UbiE